MKKSKLMQPLIVLFVLFIFEGTASAQRVLSGKVIDATTQEALPGVNIIVKGTTHGVATNPEGLYEITLSAAENILIFSQIGYESQEILVGDMVEINVALVPSITQLDEIVVTGYGGVQHRSKLTNSIATVKEEVFSTGAYSNPAKALSGAVAGLRVTQSSGKPGSVPSLVLRGGTNFDGTGSPLILVDGVVRTISDINPEDIASMEVLKDAGATALYGARANNGVVLITTKRGKEGKTEIDVKVRKGLNYLNQPYDFMNATDYLYWARTAVYRSGNYFQTNAGVWTGHGAGVQASLNGAQPYGLGNKYFDEAGLPIDGNASSLAIWSPMRLTDNLKFLLDNGWKTMKDPVTGDDIIYSEFDRSSTAFNSPADMRDVSLSMKGGNDRGTYYASMGYQDEEGLPVNTWYKRFNFMLNGDYRIREWFTSSTSFSLNNARWNDSHISYENYFGRMLSAPPTQREYNAKGQLLLGSNASDGNPLYNADKFINKRQTDKFTISQGFLFNIYRGLDLKLTANWLYSEGHYESFSKDYLSRPGVWVTTRSSSASFDRELSQTYNGVLTYDANIADIHSVKLLVGSEFYDIYDKGLSASGSGAPTDDFMDLNYTSTEEGKRGIDSWHDRQRILSFFGRANYDFREKYLLSLTFRRDGYSKLLGDNQWGFFPGISAGWILSRERFMNELSNIFSFAKLRISYGLNGNVSNIGSYELQGSYSSTKYNGQVGYLIGSIPNPGLRWERSNTFETGADMGLFDNRINVNITYYNRLTLDKYAFIPLPTSSGVSSIRSNNGEFRNKGVEVELVYKIMRKQDLKWDVSANLAYNVNTVEKLPDNGLENNRQGAFQVYNSAGDLIWVGGYQEGQRPGGLWVFMAEGIYKDEAEVAAIAGKRIDRTTGNNGSNGRPLYGPELWNSMTDAQRGNGLPIQPGDVIWKDVNGDNIIDNMDRVYVGNTTPKYIGGITTNLSYKGITFSARMDYAIGFKQLDNIRPWYMGMMQGSFNTLEDTKDTWTPENRNAKYPIYVWADQLGKRNYARPSSMFVYEASYISFREISLSYAIPTSWMKILKNTNLELSVTCLNLGYLTKSKLFSPEVINPNGVNAEYGLPRTFIFGANLKF